MQIILMEKVVNLGALGDVVNVKNGYARNFLIPQGKAKRATDAAKAEFEAKRAELEKKAAEILAAAVARGVTNSDISEALTKQGFDVKKGEVVMPNGPLKTIGDFPIVLDLHTDVKAHITVSVLGEHV
jgi:large subunit ribosomal protein L9